MSRASCVSGVAVHHDQPVHLGGAANLDQERRVLDHQVIESARGERRQPRRRGAPGSPGA